MNTGITKLQQGIKEVKGFAAVGVLLENASRCLVLSPAAF
jgi:hypothetical protein